MVTVEVAKEYKTQMAKPDLVFLTKDNQEKFAGTDANGSPVYSEETVRALGIQT